MHAREVYPGSAQFTSSDSSSRAGKANVSGDVWGKHYVCLLSKLAPDPRHVRGAEVYLTDAHLVLYSFTVYFPRLVVHKSCTHCN